MSLHLQTTRLSDGLPSLAPGAVAESVERGPRVREIGNPVAG